MAESARWRLQVAHHLRLVILVAITIAVYPIVCRSLARVLILRLVRLIVAWSILCLDGTPDLVIDLVLIKITPWVACATSKQIDRVAMSQQDTRVSW